MSTMILLKDHEAHKKGASVSVPYLKGKDLIQRGVARYPDQPAQPAAPDQAGENARLKAENARLKAELEAAQQQPPGPDLKGLR